MMSPDAYTPASNTEDDISTTYLSETKRPPNAFLLWSAIQRKRAPSHIHQTTLSKTLGEVWRNMSTEEKAQYYTLAENLKQRHRHAFPNYQFRCKRLTPKTLAPVYRRRSSVTSYASSTLTSSSLSPTSLCFSPVPQPEPDPSSSSVSCSYHHVSQQLVDMCSIICGSAMPACGPVMVTPAPLSFPMRIQVISKNEPFPSAPLSPLPPPLSPSFPLCPSSPVILPIQESPMSPLLEIEDSLMCPTPVPLVEDSHGFEEFWTTQESATGTAEFTTLESAAPYLYNYLIETPPSIGTEFDYLPL